MNNSFQDKCKNKTVLQKMYKTCLHDSMSSKYRQINPIEEKTSVPRDWLSAVLTPAVQEKGNAAVTRV
jgi:hypothetical protein